MGKYNPKSGHSAILRYDMTEFNEFIEKLEKTSTHEKTTEYVHHILYPTVGSAADELRQAVKELQIDSEKEILKSKGKPMKRGVTLAEREALEDGLGITKHNELNDGIDSKAGFGGYCDLYPNSKYNSGKGFPIPLLANSICAGTSFRKQDDFVIKAYNRFKTKYAKNANQASEEWLKDNGF